MTQAGTMSDLVTVQGTACRFANCSRMKTKLVAASAASALLATLAACGSNDPTPTEEVVAQSTETPSSADASPSDSASLAPAGSTATPGATQTNPVGDPEAPDIAGENCIKELAKLANQPASKISVARVEVDNTGPTHYLMIQGAAAPWSCKTAPNASVIDLVYTQEG